MQTPTSSKGDFTIRPNMGTPLLLVFTLAILGTALPSAALDTDSLEFSIVRQELDSLAGDEVSSIYLRAADELAQSGLFESATDILMDALASVGKGWGDTLASHRQPDSARSTVPRNRLTRWTVDASARYDRWEDSSSLPPSGEVQNDIATAAVSGNLGVDLEWRVPKMTMTTLNPSVDMSEKEGRAGLRVRSQTPQHLLFLDASLTGKKSLGQEYGDSSDGFAGMALAQISTKPLDKKWTLALPLTIQAEHFREQRPGYVSFQRYGVEPYFEAHNNERSLIARIQAQGDYRDYQSYDDSLDRLSAGPAVNLDFWGESGSFGAQASYLLEWYPRGYSPRQGREIIVETAASFKAAPTVSLSIESGVRHERERHQSMVAIIDSVVPWYSLSSDSQAIKDTMAQFTLSGLTIDLKPGIHLLPSEKLSFSFDLALSGKKYPLLLNLSNERELVDPQFLWESLLLVEPSIGLEYLSEKVRFGVWVSYAFEDIAEKTTYILTDSRSLNLNGSCSWQVTDWLSLSADAGYRYTAYADGRIASSPSVMATTRMVF